MPCETTARRSCRAPSGPELRQCVFDAACLVAMMNEDTQESVLTAKQENPKRSIRQILRLLEATGLQANLSLSRSATLLSDSGLGIVR